MRELLQVSENSKEEGILKPSLPLELAKWIECNEISSSNLRNNLWQRQSGEKIQISPKLTTSNLNNADTDNKSEISTNQNKLSKATSTIDKSFV